MQTVAPRSPTTRRTFSEQVDRRGAGDCAEPRRPRAAVRESRCGPTDERRRDLAFSTAWAASAATAASTSSVSARPDHARAVGQRDRQSAVRHRRLRERQRLHLGGKQPRVPAHPVAQRSGRPTSAARPLHSRDEETGQFWSPSPLPARGPDRTSPATASATAFSSTPRTASSPSCSLRGDGCAGQVLRAQDRESAPAGRASSR